MSGLSGLSKCLGIILPFLVCYYFTCYHPHLFVLFYLSVYLSVSLLFLLIYLPACLLASIGYPGTYFISSHPVLLLSACLSLCLSFCLPSPAGTVGFGQGLAHLSLSLSPSSI